MNIVDSESLFYIDYFLDNKYIDTFGFGLRFPTDNFDTIFKRAVSKFDYLYTRLKKSCVYSSFCIKLKDKQNNLIQILYFNKGGITK